LTITGHGEALDKTSFLGEVDYAAQRKVVFLIKR